MHLPKLCLPIPLLLCLALPACSDDSSETAGAGASAGTGGAGAAGGTGGAAGDGASGGAAGAAQALPFRLGVNGGFPNPDWTDQQLAQLEVAAGCNSQRLSLPERHLDRWGYDIEVSDLEGYATLGMSSQVGFLTSPIREHSTAPAEAEDWELAHYLPSGLYEPITLADGTINPDNHWGAYVYQAVLTYSPWIRVWEIWNEPDWVSDWSVTQTWWTEPPTADELPRFNGSVYEYVRMLRVSRAAARLADPAARIATGGLGYAGFLSAVLRYTDNPVDGSAAADYPETGGSYIDVLSFHHYPIYTAGNSDAGVDGYLDHRQALADELDEAGKAVELWQTTESGAPHEAVQSYPGGSEYARNYIMKLMISAHAVGVDGVDWFVLSDHAEAGASTDPHDFMGLYGVVSDLQTIDQATRTDAGIAYATLGALLGGASYDASRSAELGLAEPVRGGAFVTGGGDEALALWKRADDGGESSSGELVIDSDAAYLAHDWDFSQSAQATLVEPTSGQVTLALSGSVRIFLRQ